MENPNDFIRPRTNCKLPWKGRNTVACDDYHVKEDGKVVGYNFSCCDYCGWNPKVAEKRLEALKAKREKEREMAKRRAKYGLT